MYKLKCRVLLVDDEENILRSLSRLLMGGDCEVLTAPSGEEGLRALEKAEVSVIVSDQRMPGMSGAEFLERSKEKAPDAVRIILTGYADISSAIGAINRGGAYKYISKPWNNQDFLLAIRDAAERYRLVKENQYLTAELKKWSSELELYVQQQTIDLSRQNKDLVALNEKLSRNMKGFITSFSNLLEIRDRGTHSHSNNVAFISSLIARKIKLGEKEAETVSVAAQLHDIGKIGMRHEALSKEAGELSAGELEEYKKHPVIGQAALAGFEELQAAGLLIRHHHEKWDGSGFPDGLHREKIPLGSRIIAIADRLDRIARINAARRRGPEEIFRELSRHIDTSLDRGLFDCAREALSGEDAGFLLGLNEDEFEMDTTALLPGMVLSRDVTSGTGLLLLSKGHVLTDKSIETLKHILHVDPSRGGIFVRAGAGRK